MLQTNLSAANNMAAASAIMLQAVQGITANGGHLEATKEPEVYNMTSGLFPCVCVAMYETILSPQAYEDSLNDGEEEFCFNTVNYKDWKKSLTEAAQEYLDDSIIDCLRDYGLLNIHAEGIWSPKYYNYHNDELVMEVTMQHDWQKKMTAKVAEWQHNEAVKDYISKYWHSCDGYINFMPESLGEILTETNEDRQLAAYLTLALIAECVNLDYAEILCDLYYRMDDFSGYERTNVIEEYYTIREEAWELLEVWNDDTQWDMLYWALFERIGSPWSRQPETKELSSKKDPCTSYQADSDGKRLLFWAVQNKLTAQELQKLAAGETDLTEIMYNHLS